MWPPRPSVKCKPHLGDPNLPTTCRLPRGNQGLLWGPTLATGHLSGPREVAAEPRSVNCSNSTKRSARLCDYQNPLPFNRILLRSQPLEQEGEIVYTNALRIKPFWKIPGLSPECPWRPRLVAEDQTSCSSKKRREEKIYTQNNEGTMTTQA
ncbi:hypothetical protein E5288_WYG007732 [Bos mutus]|uniref:Uncharacterized protein n=1 Tax=Bos mutus TaxID=72004 RepID=A0A6B0REM6_9CETA|nr:hypothetical protein [Bos mutus]